MTETNDQFENFDKKITYNAVFYTDGGCQPNPGFAGSGVHGYLYDKNAQPLKKPEAIANNFIRRPENITRLDYMTATINRYKEYVPGETEVKDAVKPLAYLDIAFSFFEPTTNNVAELNGVTRAIHSLNMAMEAGIKIEKAYFWIDSQYALKTLETYGDAYRRNGWVTSLGEPAKNRGQIELMLTMRDRSQELGLTIQPEWIRGHQTDIGNGMADYNATIGVRRSRAADNPNQPRWVLAKNYWDAKNDIHPFLTFRRSFFNRVSSLNTPGQYFMIEPAAEDLTIGKRDHEAYAIVKLRDPNIYMEAVREAQSKFGQDENRILVDRMDRVTNKMVQKFVREHGHFCLGPSANGNGVVFLDRTPVALEHSPAALFYRVIDAFGVLGERLEQFTEITGGTDVDPTETSTMGGMVVHDVTSEFYIVEDKNVPKLGVVKKMTLKPEFVVGYKNHVLSVDETRDGITRNHKFPMALGMDLPNRNALKQLEDHNPNVYLVTWKASPDVLQYAFVIDCLTGIGMWSNYFCDRLFLKNG